MKVYFLCTGNSCRSQMAEGFAKKYLPNDWEIKSAGVEQHGLNPNAVLAMQDVGIDISTHTSSLIDEAYLNTSDLVITLCGDANDKCPMTPNAVTRLHWDLTDPARVTGSDVYIKSEFAKTRDKIKDLVLSLIEP